jgi:hypothetical protein
MDARRINATAIAFRFSKVGIMVEGPDFGLAHVEAHEVTLIDKPI